MNKTTKRHFGSRSTVVGLPRHEHVARHGGLVFRQRPHGTRLCPATNSSNGGGTGPATFFVLSSLLSTRSTRTTALDARLHSLECVYFVGSSSTNCMNKRLARGRRPRLLFMFDLILSSL